MSLYKINFVNRYFFPVHAGIETMLLQMPRHFDPKKYFVTMHVSASTLSEQNILPLEAKKEHVSIKRYKTVKGLFLPKLSYNHLDALFLTNFTLVPHLFIFSSIVMRKMIGVKGFKTVFFPCGGFTPDWEIFSPTKRFIKQTIHIIIGRRLINYAADSVIAISNWEKAELIKNHIDSGLIHVIPLGVEDEAFLQFKTSKISQKTRNLVKAAKPYVIQVSRIHRIKNIDTTIRALALMKNPFTYIIAGGIEDKNYFEELQTLLREKKLTKNVIFAGRISIADKYYLIDHSVGMVHLSLNESFGLSVYEGMSRGKICIAANNSALPEAVVDGKNGYLIETEDANTLAKKLAYLQTEKGRVAMKKMEKNNKNQMKQYRWKNVAVNVQGIL
jgi:glycosyltransferase involved in cell wall biosynthesis